MQDVRGVLSYLLGFAKRGSIAPIEDRAPPSPRPAEPAVTTPLPPPPVIAITAPAPEPSVTTAPAREPAPRALPPVEVVDFAAQGRRALAETVPQTAARAEDEVARVLWIAASAGNPAQDHAVIDALQRAWPSNAMPILPVSTAPAAARQLSDDARQAFMARRDVVSAFDLQVRAFGANPRDAEVAGNLAYLYLKLNPAQPEMARRVVMHAIGVSAAQSRATRADDWNTLAVANALTGRDRDATNAFYVAIALTRNLDRTCRTALAAVDSFGERVAGPVQAMMLRLRQQGRDGESTNCALPSRWQSARG